MKEYTSDNPVFSAIIKIIEETDPGHADNINAAITQLLQNTVSNREILGSKSDKNHLHDYLPLSGGTLYGDLLLTSNSTSERVYRGCKIFHDGMGGNYRCFFNQSFTGITLLATASNQNALLFTRGKDDDTEESYAIFHEGNFAATDIVTIGNAEPSNVKALWVNPEENEIMAYVDGAWQDIYGTVDYTADVERNEDVVENMWSTSVCKKGSSVYFTANITVQEVSSYTCLLGTLPEAVKPLKTVSMNAVSNYGDPCYLYVNTDGTFGLTKPKSSDTWSKGDGIRLCMQYII